jgi:hypothetical protein
MKFHRLRVRFAVRVVVGVCRDVISAVLTFDRGLRVVLRLELPKSLAIAALILVWSKGHRFTFLLIAPGPEPRGYLLLVQLASEYLGRRYRLL